MLYSLVRNWRRSAVTRFSSFWAGVSAYRIFMRRPSSPRPTPLNFRMMSSQTSRLSKLLESQNHYCVGGWKGLPSKTNTAAVSHTVSEDLAGQDGVAQENGSKLLYQIRMFSPGQQSSAVFGGVRRSLTTSVKVFGKLEM